MTESQNNEHWREKLSAEAFKVCREKGTEAPFSGMYNDEKSEGTYLCNCCGEALFNSQEKYDSGSGWPSFWAPFNEQCISEVTDSSHGMQRVEIQCRHCLCHLGHRFTDGPLPTGQRYCVNSLSLKFQKT